jgi:hypothetical protein
VVISISLVFGKLKHPKPKKSIFLVEFNLGILDEVSCPEHQQDPPLKGEEFVFGHRVGQAILHLGKHRYTSSLGFLFPPNIVSNSSFL